MLHISKYMWLVFYSFLSFFYSEVFLLRSHVSKQWLKYQWWYAYHSLRNHGLYRVKHIRATSVCFDRWRFWGKGNSFCRSQWPRGLRRRSAPARLLTSWVRTPPGAWMSVCCECRVVEVSWQANHSSRGVLPTVVRRWMWSRNLANEEAQAHGGLLRQLKKSNK